MIPMSDETPEIEADEEINAEDSVENNNEPEVEEANAAEENDGSSSVAEKLGNAQRGALAAKQTLLVAKSMLGGIGTVLGNPITWIVLLVLVVLLVGVSIFQILGKNENANGCEGLGGGGLSLVGNPDPKNLNEMRGALSNWLMTTNFEAFGNKPMTLNQTAAMIGNMQRESQLDYQLTESGFLSNPESVSNQEIINLGNVSLKAVGLIQWDGSRRQELAKYAEANGQHWANLDTQLSFLKKELDGWEGRNLAASGFTDESKSLEQLVTIVNCKFERSGDCSPNSKYSWAAKARAERQQYAVDFMNAYSPGSGAVARSGGSCLLENGGPGSFNYAYYDGKVCAPDNGAVYQNGRLPSSALCPIGIQSHKLRPYAAASFIEMNKAYKAHFGKDICITDSYRPYHVQVSLKRRKPRLAATPGKSNHGWGNATDLCGGINSFGTPQHKWMRANGERFGWRHPKWAQINGSKPEAWHFEFIDTLKKKS